MSKVRRSLVVAFADTYVLTLIQFATSLVIARLLSPEEIGIFSVAVVAVSIAHTLRDFGIASYLIKERELDPAMIRAAAALSFATSWTLALAICGASFPIAAFYHEPRLLHLLWVLAFNFVLIPFGSITFSLLRRELRMGALFFIRLVSTLASAGTSIALAWNGHGPMSLALSITVNIVVSIVCVSFFRPTGVPRLPSFSGMTKILAFSWQSLVSNVSAEITKAAPDAVLGRVQDMAAVGLFGRATGLVDMFGRLIVNGIWSVTLPYFSKVRREGGDLASALTQAQTYIAGLAWPFYSVLGLTAYPVVVTLYGARWEASVPVLELLCVAGVLTSANMFIGSTLTAADRMDVATRLTLKMSAVRIVLVLVGAPFGIVPLASLMIVSAIIEYLISLSTTHSVLRVRFAGLLPGYRKSALLAAWCSIAPLATLAAGLMHELRIGGLLALGGISVAMWLAGVMLLRHPLRAEIELTAAAVRRQLRRGR